VRHVDNLGSEAARDEMAPGARGSGGARGALAPVEEPSSSVEGSASVTASATASRTASASGSASRPMTSKTSDDKEPKVEDWKVLEKEVEVRSSPAIDAELITVKKLGNIVSGIEQDGTRGHIKWVKLTSETGYIPTEGQFVGRPLLLKLPRGATQDAELIEKTAAKVKDFFIRNEGSSLRAWILHFDWTNDQKISSSEFIRGMRKMNFPGEVNHLFSILDSDHSGELSLEEIDPVMEALWRRFRGWCVGNFKDIAEMMRKLADTVKGATPVEVLNFSQFKGGLERCGWDGGGEDQVFQALAGDDGTRIQSISLKWLEAENRRQRRKEQAKRKADFDKVTRKSGKDENAGEIIRQFKEFLKRKYGNLIRAWRKVLSPDGSMVIMKAAFFKAVNAMGWLGDVRHLWSIIDRDDSGYVSIEELDGKNAETLAHFHRFSTEKFGSAVACFRALDKSNRKKLRQEEFTAALKGFGFQHPTKPIFNAFDVETTKTIVEDDVRFIDKWKPPPYLVAEPDPQAADQLKQILLHNYGNYLKAWRHTLDVDSSNRCNWDEFEAACKKLLFKNNVAGAWRYLDDDLSGFISLHEIDPVSSDILSDFKAWCEDQFGGVRSAYGVFDNDGGGDVSFREFRRSCRIYGFEGNVHSIFRALDVERGGGLSVDEVKFLDDWNFPNEDEPEGQAVMGLTLQDSLFSTGKYRTDLNLPEYANQTPGPACYSLSTTIGANPTMPMNRFSGAFTFRRRPVAARLPGISRDSADEPAPGDYDDTKSRAVTWRRKACAGFGSAVRPAVEPLVPCSSSLPGPGSYGTPKMRVQSASCQPRRPLKVHPLFREGLPPREFHHGLPGSPRQSQSARLPVGHFKPSLFNAAPQAQLQDLNF